MTTPTPRPQTEYTTIWKLCPNCDGDRFINIVGQMEQVKVLAPDGLEPLKHRLSHPIQQSSPKIATNKNNRKRHHLQRLNQRETLEELVHRAKTTREDDKPLGVFHKHHFANEEVPKVQLDVLVGVGHLLQRQRDVQPD